MSGLVGSLNSTVNIRQFASGQRRQAQPHSIMDINAVRFNNDQKDKTIVLSFTRWQTELHISQKVYGAVCAYANLFLWLDKNHCLCNRIFIQPIKYCIYFVYYPLGGIAFPAHSPM